MDKWIQMLVVGFLNNYMTTQYHQVIQRLNQQYQYDLADPEVGEMIARNPDMFIKRVLKCVVFSLTHG